MELAQAAEAVWVQAAEAERVQAEVVRVQVGEVVREQAAETELAQAAEVEPAQAAEVVWVQEATAQAEAEQRCRVRQEATELRPVCRIRAPILNLGTSGAIPIPTHKGHKELKG